MTDERSPRARQQARKVRVDVLLVEQGLALSRAKAQALVLAGQVLRGTDRIDKAGTLIARDTVLTVKDRERYVSRGGYKLEGALSMFGIDVTGLVCVDVGASTGGFTDCLLQRGATRVYAVDVGQGLLAQKLVGDNRVVVRDRTNARFLSSADFPEEVDMIVVDASFIGIAKLVDALFAMGRPGAQALVMIKPQFEVGREEAAKSKGVIRDPLVRDAAIRQATEAARTAGFEVVQGVDSALAGPKGNVEHFLWLTRPK